jgi:enoyl-CoA hydratase/carnithine racemase
MSDGGAPLRVSLADGVLTLTLDRPDKRNALSAALIDRREIEPHVRVEILEA